jgi:hypothetical protein
MLRKVLVSCGIAAPVLYVVTAIIGAACRGFAMGAHSDV